MNPLITAILAAAASGGSGQITLNLNAHTASYVGLANGTAGVRFGNDGILDIIGDSTTADGDEWVEEQPITSGQAGDYEVAYTQLVSGSAPDSLAASLGVYVALNANRTWTLTSGVGDDGVWKFRVREIANTSNFVEANITVSIVITP